MLTTALLLMTLAPNFDRDASTSALSTAPTLEARARASKLLLDSLSSMPAAPEEALAKARAAAKSAREILGDVALNSARLSATVDVAASEMKDDAARVVKRVARELDRIANDLVFTPKTESERPVGFPDATPVGEVCVLDYPAYRMAKVTMSKSSGADENSAFWKLFRHIQSNQIPMTAPVETTFEHDAKGERAQTMCFLYASTEVGRLGTQGEVEVVDVAAARVLSIGLRGYMTEGLVATAREELRAWLKQHPTFEEAGPSRTMGWNSPMIAEARRFGEVQIPIRAKSTK